MKRLHRRWHRLIWALMVPGLTVLLVSTKGLRGDPAPDAVLPPALSGSNVEGGR